MQAPDARAFAAPETQQPLQLAPIPSVVPQPSLQESYTTLLPEEEQLLQLARQYGKPWSSIHRMLPHKAERDLRKHYNAVIKPKVRARLCQDGQHAVPACLKLLKSKTEIMLAGGLGEGCSCKGCWYASQQPLPLVPLDVAT